MSTEAPDAEIRLRAVAACLRAVLACTDPPRDRSGEARPSGGSLLSYPKRLYGARRARPPERPRVVLPDMDRTRLMTVVLPGAEAADVGALLQEIGAGFVVDLAGLGERLAMPATMRLESPDLRARALDEDWFVDARLVAERVADALVEVAAADPLGEEIRTHAAAFTLRLKHEIAAVLRPVRSLRGVADAFSPAHVLLLEGAFPAEAYRAALIADGMAPEAVSVASVSARASERRAARDAVAPSWSPPPMQTALAELSLAVAQARPAVWLPTLAGRAVVVADLRNARDFRHRAFAERMFKPAREKRPVVLLQHVWRINRNVLRTVWQLWRGHRWAVRPGLVATPNRPSRAVASLSWRSALLAALAKRLPQLGTGDAAEDCAIIEIVGVFLSVYLVEGLGLVRLLSGRFRHERPAWIAAVPGGKGIAPLVATSARAAGIPSIDVQTLIIGVSERDSRPLARYCAVIDLHQRDLLMKRFGLAPGDILVAGHDQFAEWRRRALGDRRSNDAPGRGRSEVLFPTQPLEALCIPVLQALVAALGTRPDVSLRVVPHPDETPAVTRRYAHILAAAGGAPRFTLAPPGIRYEDLAAAAVVVTLVSNTAIRAALMERPVLVVDFTGGNLPLRFDQMGLAIVAHTPEEVRNLLADLLDGGRESHGLRERRAAYLAANPQLATPSAAETIVAFMEAQS